MRLTVSRPLSEPGDQGPVSRRRILTIAAIALAMLLAGLLPALARDITDATGRTVTVPDAPVPETMVGQVSAPREGDLPWLVPTTHALPQLGRLTGKGGTVNQS